ncbi:MAG: phosphatidylglycerophosphatase A [Rhodobacterales bacterium]|nr:MAG: phosphatidylglycerophosphatase A [Rhodobacterales bacterium]
MTQAFTTMLGIGHLRPAPGTWGSVAAVLIAYGLHIVVGPVGIAIALAVTIAFSPRAIAAHINATGHKDPSEVVIDEAAGQWLALLPVSIGAWHVGAPAMALWPGWVSAFVLFRLFDIWKPWLVGRADAKGTAWGVLEDDLWAGLFAALGTVALAALSHGVLMR